MIVAMGQRSWAKGAPLERVEWATPDLRGFDVLVRVAAAGVNPVDWKMREFGPLRLAARLVGPALPFVPGVCFAGVVEAVGAQVQGLEPGAPVVGGTDFSRGQRGGYADHVLVREDQLCRLPPAVKLEEAACLPVPGVTAWHSLVELGRIRAVQPERRRVLVLGASGAVGQLLVQLCRMEEAFVAGVCSTPNVALVRALGADEVIDYREGEPLAQARAFGPYQLVVDCVGHGPFGEARALLQPGGRHVLVAGDSPVAMAQSVIAPFTSRAVLGRPTGAKLRPLVEALAAGRLKVRIEHRLPLAQAEEAHRLSRTGRMTGRILLLP